MNDIHFLKASIEQAYTTSVKETINEIQTVINEKEDQNWEDLRRDLVTGGYLQGSTKELFNSALNGNYPANEAKMIWTKSRREAAVFCDWLGWKNSEWKKCFQFSKGRPFLEGDDYKKFEVYKQTQKINQILSKYTNKEKFRY